MGDGCDRRRAQPDPRDGSACPVRRKRRRHRRLGALRARLLLFAALAAAAPAPAETPKRRVAVTFDDLPAVAVVGDGIDAWRSLNARLLEAIARHGVPAIGFVNEGKLEAGGNTNPARVALLKAWIDAGLELGNHTFSHRDLHRASLPDYESEIARGEAVTRGLLHQVGRKPRYFRHPQLHSGRDLATKRAVEAYLSKRGYAVAPVTVDNSEWVFAKAYELASERGDRAAADRVAAAYVPYMASMFDYCERQSRALFGREIPQVLLLHANSLNAERFDELARMMKGRGYAFVPLEEALRDPAYRSKDTWVGGEGITWLHRWALSTGRRKAILPDEPRTPEFVMKESGIAAE